MKVYSVLYRAGMLALSDEHTPGGGVGRLLPSHCSIFSHPKPCSPSWQSTSLLTFLTVKKAGRSGDRMVAPFPLETAQGLPASFLHMLLASCDAITVMPRATGKHVCGSHLGNASLPERNKWNLSTTITLCCTLFVRYLKYPGTTW